MGTVEVSAGVQCALWPIMLLRVAEAHKRKTHKYKLSLACFLPSPCLQPALDRIPLGSKTVKFPELKSHGPSNQGFRF